MGILTSPETCEKKIMSIDLFHLCHYFLGVSNQ